jgi:molecular chaperone DnaK
MPQVEVTFDIDANGVLSVKAKDKATNKEQSVKIEASTGLSKEEIERMKKDAELYAAEDKSKREAAEVRNTADAMIYTAEKAIRDAGDKVPAEVKKDIEEKVEALKKVKDGGEIDAVKKASQELAVASQKIGEILYKQDEGQKAKDESSGGEPNVKDAEFEEKDDSAS